MDIRKLSIVVGLTSAGNLIVLYAGEEPAKAQSRLDRAIDLETVALFTFPIPTTVRHPLQEKRSHA